MMQPRNNTGLSGRSRWPQNENSRAPSWRNRARQRPPKQGLRQQKITAYRLSWEALEAVLKTIYPNLSLRNVSVEEDHFVIEVPRELTPADLQLIEDARAGPSALNAPALIRRETSEEPTS